MPENRAFQNNAPERVVSLQPSVTVTLRDLGTLDRLVACTKYCVDVCPEVLETGCIVVEDSWSAKADQIMAAKPDLVIASVPYQMESVAEILKSGVPFLGLAPKCMGDIYKDIMMIARIVASEVPGASEACALKLVATMKKEVESMWQRTMGAERPLVYCEVGQAADSFADVGGGTGGSRRRTLLWPAGKTYDGRRSSRRRS